MMNDHRCFDFCCVFYLRFRASGFGALRLFVRVGVVLEADVLGASGQPDTPKFRAQLIWGLGVLKAL